MSGIYNKTSWVDDSVPALNASNLNNIEDGIEDAVRQDLSVVHNIATDANYTLTASQNQYGRIEITDTGVLLTAGRDIIMNNNEHTFLFVNSTAQTLTVKTSGGAGIAISGGEAKELRNNTTNVVEYEAASAQVVLQTVYTELTTSGTGSGNIPFDGTIPQNTEGNEILTLAITPKKSDSKLLIMAQTTLGEVTNTGDSMCAAIFRDSVADAKAIATTLFDENIFPRTLNILHQEDSTSTATTTFKLRVGIETGAVRWNGAGNTQYYGAANKTTLKIMEVE